MPPSVKKIMLLKKGIIYSCLPQTLPLMLKENQVQLMHAG